MRNSHFVAVVFVVIAFFFLIVVVDAILKRENENPDTSLTTNARMDSTEKFVLLSRPFLSGR